MTDVGDVKTGRPTVEVVYVGRRFQRGKIGHWFEVPWSGDPISWPKVRKAPGPIGGIVSVEHDGDPSDGVYLGTFGWTGEMHEDGEARPGIELDWAAEDRAAYTKGKQQAAKTKAMAEARDFGEMTIAQAGQWLRNAPQGQSAARLAVLISVLQNEIG